MNMYINSDVELLKKNINNIKHEVEKIKEHVVEPTLENQKKIQKIIKDYCIEKKRKIYGGFAWNLLITDKNPDDKLYADNKIPDIDMYSPEPLTDWYNICNLLFKEGYIYVQGEEAQHQETYSIKVNRQTFCDISYVPKNIYNRMQYIEINKFYCIDPKFIAIDYFRVISDPMTSYWRLFECGEELKMFKRYVKLQTYYKLPYKKSDLIIENISKEKEKALNTILKFIVNKKSVINIGLYAYNYFCVMSNYKHIKIPYYEFISIKYKEDALELLDILKKSFNDITYQEFYPFFQFTDYNVEIYLEKMLLCRIYANNKKSIPYQEISEINFNLDKPIKIKNDVIIGSFPIIMLYFLIGAMKAYVNKDKNLENFNYHAISHCIQMRNEYFTKYGKTFLDDTIFKEFVTKCMGEIVTPENERMLLIEKRKKNKEPSVYRYEPKDGIKEPPKFTGFKNSSGNSIKNPMNLRLTNIQNNEIENNEDEETNDTNDSNDTNDTNDTNEEKN